MECFEACKEIKAGTYGFASSVGKAASWILEGALNPISYTPLSSSSSLKKGQFKHL